MATIAYAWSSRKLRSAVSLVGCARKCACDKADADPAAELDLSALRVVVCTGSPLPSAGWSWLGARLPDARVDCSSGGTDVCSSFVCGSPVLPVYSGEISGRAQVISGDWVPDPRGVCRENLDDPKPGSEKMGILELTPGVTYGSEAFTIQARYYEERPEVTHGSEMDAGIAFGIRDPGDFDLVEQNALHDILRLDEFVHDTRRDLREKLFRTHGNEWHTLSLGVSGASVTAGADGQTIYTVTDVPNTDGPIGLWARAAGATCFSDVSVTVGHAS